MKNRRDAKCPFLNIVDKGVIVCAYMDEREHCEFESEPSNVDSWCYSRINDGVSTRVDLYSKPLGEIDRKRDWRDFSAYMDDQYLDRTIEKYGKQVNAPDLMHWTPQFVCVWNILKYGLRLWNEKGKGRELEKIAHYAQMAWTMGNEEEK
jgi:hypothetical protein